MRPNIRVEIQNNLPEEMDVDANEEGEISPDEDEPTPEPNPPEKVRHPLNSDRFQAPAEPPADPAKLSERARRFQLDPADPNAEHPKRTGGSTVFGRNKHLTGKESDPWSALAENWDEDEMFREAERKEQAEVGVQVRNPTLRVRLGAKRGDEPPPAAVEEAKRSKVPRMRMYADEEEEKIRRKKILTKIDHVIQQIDEPERGDLRKVLKSRTAGGRREEVADLGARLRNRSKKMVFELSTEPNRFADRLQARSAPEVDEVASEEEFEEDFEEEEEEWGGNRTKSKVAVVIRTQRRPTVRSAVASTVWSRVGVAKQEEGRSEGEEVSDGGVEEEEGFVSPMKRPGFCSEMNRKEGEKKALKIEINNDHFRK